MLCELLIIVSKIPEIEIMAVKLVELVRELTEEGLSRCLGYTFEQALAQSPQLKLHSDSPCPKDKFLRAFDEQGSTFAGC